MTLVAPPDTLAGAVEAADARYVAANPASAQRHADARRSMPGGNTRSVLQFAPFPVAFASAAGATLVSLDGNRYTDFLGEFTAGLYGHSHPVLQQAMHRAIEGGLGFGGVNALEQRFARLLSARFPSMQRLRFTNSGTEANLMALALATHATGRAEVLVFRGGYHGGVLSFGEGVPSAVTVPHSFVLADYDDLEGTRAILRERGASIAAVLVEPMLGSAGCIPAGSAFLRMLRDETRAAESLLIFDEVMTSRLGPSGLQGAEGITPDLTTLGKYLGGGASFGAFGGRADLMARFDSEQGGPLAHAGTFNNNLLSMAAGLAGLEQVLTDEALEALNTRGDRLREAINALAARRGVVLHASGRGSMLALHPDVAPLHPVRPPTARQAALRRLLFLDLVDAGFWIASRGFIALSLAVTDDDCDRFVAALETIVTERAALFAA